MGVGVSRPAAAATTPGNRVAMLGDSITGTFTLPAVGTSSYSLSTGAPMPHAHFYDQRIVLSNVAGVSGNTSAQMLARIQTDIIAYLPDWCVVMAGSNDAGNAVSVATYAANMTAIHNALKGAGIRTVFCCCPPQSSATVQTGITKRLLGSRYNAWLRYFAYRNAIPFVDFLPTVMDPTTGGWLSTYDSGDGIHPNAAGYKVIGEAIASTIAPLLRPFALPLMGHAVTADSANLCPNALFLTDSNSDGVPDSWGKTGTGTVSIIASPGAPVTGNALRLQDTTNTFNQCDGNLPANCWTSGDRIAFCGRFKSATSGSGSGSVVLKFTSASPAQTVKPVSSYAMDSGGWRTFYIEYITPGTTTTGAVSLQGQGTAVDIQLAQPSVYNLTALGVA